MIMAFLTDVPIIHHLSQGSRHNLIRIRTRLYASNIYFFKRFHPFLVPLVYLAHHIEIAQKRRKLARYAQAQTSPERTGPDEDGRPAPSAAEVGAQQAACQEAIDLLNAELRMKRAPRIPTF